MDAVTYPDDRVAAFTMESLIPLRVPFDTEPLATDFILRWTPTLIILGKDGKEHARFVGFIAPEDYISTFLLGAVKAFIGLKQIDRAAAALDRIINEYPKSFATPEAIYYRGVCEYKTTDSVAGLKGAYERLLKEYPASEWVKRAMPYRLL